jgi:hypothetical protein
MVKSSSISPQTRNNWLIDAMLFSSAVIVLLTSIYFLFLPVSGYRGGRNLAYGLVILFDRHTWEDLHTWGGIAMILIVAVHLPLHWSWVVSMARRTFKELLNRCGLSQENACLSKAGRFNLWINTTIALSGLVAAISGLYFFFVPHDSGLSRQVILFNSTTWDVIHTWAGVILVNAAILHFAIHWKWVTKVSGKVIGALAGRLSRRQNIASPLT